MTLGERVRKVADYKTGGNLTRLSTILGYPRASLSNVANGSTLPKVDFVVAFLENLPEVNIRWLFLGEGEMLIKSDGAEEKGKDLSDDRFDRLMDKLEKMDNRIQALERGEE